MILHDYVHIYYTMQVYFRKCKKDSGILSDKSSNSMVDTHLQMMSTKRSKFKFIPSHTDFADAIGIEGE